MKVQWNDTVLDTDTATANKDGSFTWTYLSASLTYVPDTGQMLSCSLLHLDKCVLPIIYKKQTK